MRKTISVRRGLSWAFAAMLAVAATPAVHAASESAAARSKLNNELPAGVTLAKASCNQTAAAIKEAVAKDTSMAAAILTSGIMARTPKQGQGELSCECLVKLTRAAIASDPQESSKLVDTVSSMRPDCADALSNLLGANAANGVNTPGLFDTADDYAFGVGFGPGFPGSPGFVGSPPSGAVALPPASPTPMTSVTTG